MGDTNAIRDLIEHLDERGAPADTRTDVDTASLRRRFAHLRDVKTCEVTVRARHGDQPARLYLPGAVQLRAGCVWVHGGAYVLGGIDGPEANWFSLELASRGVAVFSISYHLALNGTRFPVPLHDVCDGWQEGYHALSALGLDDSLIHLGGGSAGANLAVGAAVSARDRDSVVPATLGLLYPLAHRTLPVPSAALARSLEDMAGHYRFTAEDVAAISRNYVGPDAEDVAHAFAAEENLHGLPPTLIVTAEKDSLRSSGDALADALKTAGVQTTQECQPDIGHGHVDTPGSPGSHETIDRFGRWFARS